MPTDLNGKNAIVTGADGALAQAAIEALRSMGANVEAIDADTADLPSACRDAAERLGGVDILVNHAPPNADRPSADLHDIPLPTWNESIDRHATSVFIATQALTPSMQERGGGRVINLTTTRAHRCADQHGVAELMVHGFTIGFARELGADNVTVNTVEVGQIDELEDDRGPAPYPGTALSAPGKLSDPVGVLSLLAGEEGGWMTGQIFTVDGGGWMRPD